MRAPPSTSGRRRWPSASCSLLFGTSLEAFLTDPGARPMNELYAEDLRAARALFA